MAATDPPHNNGSPQEEKTVSCATPKPPPSLVDDLVDTVKWVWDFVVTLLKELAASDTQT